MPNISRAPRNLMGLWCAVEVVGWLYIAATAAATMALLAMLFANGEAVMIAATAAIITGNLIIALYVIGVVLTLTWYYQSTRNLHAMRVKVGYSPLWAMLWFLIPIASLWKPYGVTAELWTASSNPDEWRKSREPSLLRWWWGLFLVGAVLSKVADLFLKNPSPDDVTGSAFLIPGVACMAVSGVLFVRIGRRISLRQRDLVRSNYRRAPAENAPSWAD